MITAAIVGERELIEQLGLLGSFAKKEVRQAVDLFALKVLARAKLKLSDDVLRVRTGRLRRSINQRVTDDASGIVGTVGTNVSYAKLQELGFSGSMNVKEHLRTIKTAFGKNIKGGAVTFTVQAHSRHVEYPAHSFLASSLAELEPEFRAAVEQASKAIHL